MVKNLFSIALVMASASTASGADVASSYIYDYYDSGVTPKEYLKNYKGKPYSSVPKVGKASSTKIQAEDFDKGQAGDAYSFQNGLSGTYRNDNAPVSVSSGSDGLIVGNYMRAHGHDTTHGSIVKFKDKWYQFYHTADYSGRGNLRSVCFDELTYAPDGTINMVNTWGEPYLSTPITLLASSPLNVAAVNYNKGGVILKAILIAIRLLLTEASVMLTSTRKNGLDSASIQKGKATIK